ncbi:conserved hypothetical protein [Candidatus Methylobacter favarea]|uniref:Uncharacterized protein n=1 Tax=Candidatus Methylobacter favarea TaxID=2707345 RepID=A0A8S0Y6R0_9GAMM|nr:hypothetical protein [Candidatus Methylobacter favarea]CAA9891949.1 conserved hypothetical protein [Candidatus Methylobacter favarea]
MHDIDRTLMEYEPEMEFEADYEDGEFEYGDMEGVLDEAEEMALASELLGLMDEAELDQFFGKLFKKVGRAAGKFIKSPVGKALGGILKSAAQKALPALGTMIGGPAGGAIGSQLASAGSQIFGLELEGLSEEDQEFEMAKQFVRFAGTAAERAANASPNVEPKIAAKSAAVTAAQQHAPGLLRSAGTPGSSMSSMAATPMTGSGRSGRWMRRGRKIILYNV